MKSRSACVSEYGSDYLVQKEVKSGQLFKLDKSIYSEKKDVPELALLSYKYPNAVITMQNAFYLHGLTDSIPDSYDFATSRNAAKIKDKRVHQYFVPESLFPEGIEETDYKGYPIKAYGKERMLIELLRYKSKLPFDYYKEILLNYRRIMPQLNAQKIQDMALLSPKADKILAILQAEVL